MLCCVLVNGLFYVEIFGHLTKALIEASDPTLFTRVWYAIKVLCVWSTRMFEPIDAAMNLQSKSGWGRHLRSSNLFPHSLGLTRQREGMEKCGLSIEPQRFCLFLCLSTAAVMMVSLTYTRCSGNQVRGWDNMTVDRFEKRSLLLCDVVKVLIYLFRI